MFILKNTFSIKLPDLDDRFRLTIDFCQEDSDSITKEKLGRKVIIIDSEGNKRKCDQSRGFLIFLSDLLQLISFKETYKGALLKKYFPKDFEVQTGDEVNITS